MAEKILVVDDKQSIVEILSTALTAAGYDVETTLEGNSAIEMILSDSYDLILCDVNLPDISGTEILKKAKTMKMPPNVIMITAYGSIENAIECMKLGADDYVTKPFNLDEIKEIVKKGLEKVRLVRENIMLREELEKKYDFSGIIGKSKEMQVVFDKIKMVAPTGVTVLITGETGVGKELVAKALHYNSARTGKLVAVNCAAIPDNLMESELFGHLKGAFTGAITAKRGLVEEADGGTLLLDEIAELHPSLQAKLLRTLDEGTVRRVGSNTSIPVKFRLICSTNKDLAQEVEKGAFRLDLFHRIKVMEIKIPPLKVRREDVILVLEYYLEKLGAEHGKEITGFSAGAMNILLSHDWPGNVREIINVVEQAVLMSSGNEISEEVISNIISPSTCVVSSDTIVTEGSLKDMMARVERNIIEKVLEECGGNRKKAAGRLEMSERTLYYKLDEYNLK